MSKYDEIKNRVLEEARYIIDAKTTLRATAEVFGVSKSTVHNDVSVRLIEIDKNLYEEVSKIMDNNLQERAARGGLSTKEMYKRLKKLELMNTVKE